MKNPTHLILALILLIMPVLKAQADTATEGTLRAFDGTTTRGSSRILYLNTSTNDFAGQLVVNYGQPEWKSDYDDPALFDRMTRGQVWRMGNNFWSVLDTSLPLKINGRNVDPGYYYLGMHRSEDGGTWSLAFMDPSRIRKMHLDASEIAKAPVEFMIPMRFEGAGERVDPLRISLNHPPEDPKDVTLVVAWGPLRLLAPVEVAGLN